MIRVTLSLPPSINKAYRNTERGRALTEDAKTWKQKANVIVRNAARLAGWEPPQTDMVLILRLYFAKQRQRDVSNCIKLTEDAVATGLEVDDRWVVMPLALRAGIDKHNPRLELTVFSITGGEALANATAAFAERYAQHDSRELLSTAL